MGIDGKKLVQVWFHERGLKWSMSPIEDLRGREVGKVFIPDSMPFCDCFCSGICYEEDIEEMQIKLKEALRGHFYTSIQKVNRRVEFWGNE